MVAVDGATVAAVDSRDDAAMTTIADRWPRSGVVRPNRRSVEGASWLRFGADAVIFGEERAVCVVR